LRKQANASTQFWRYRLSGSVWAWGTLIF